MPFLHAGDARYCFPLTVADGYSRLLLACQALTSTKLVEARPVFERLFREYGLPQRIRSDNGVPFATQALGRLSALPRVASGQRHPVRAGEDVQHAAEHRRRQRHRVVARHEGVQEPLGLDGGSLVQGEEQGEEET